MTTVRAAVVHRSSQGEIDLAVESVPERALAHGELRIAPFFVGICGSDIDQLKGHTDSSFAIEFPHVLGHEWSGKVVEVGPGASTFSVGQRVVGHGDLGGNRWFGVSTDGAMAERFVVPEAMCFPVPDRVSALQAALLEPTACSLTGVRSIGGVDAGCDVLITGCGAIGLTLVALTAACGARVVAVDPSPVRRAIALSLGAALCVDSAEAEEGYMDSLPNGADVCIEASGAAQAQAACFEQAARSARVLLMGLSTAPASPLPINHVQSRHLTVTSSTGAPATSWAPTLRLVERLGLDLSPIVSDTFGLEEATRAVEAATDARLHAKVLVSISTDGE